LQAQPPPPSDDYRLGSGDKLRIEVYKDTQLSQSVQIRPDGKITLPLVGDLEATGRRPLELRDAIAVRLKEYVNNPVVTVIVVEATAAIAFVTGEVSHPGSVAAPGRTAERPAGIGTGGRTKGLCRREEHSLLRRSTSGVQTINFNYKEAIRVLSVSAPPAHPAELLGSIAMRCPPHRGLRRPDRRSSSTW
jgi:polysaccharide export outer membrane protein